MLRELHVRDLGVVEDLTVVFEPGMTALTGETGAGKTLLVHALALVLGGRAAPGLVRAGADEALVEARFEGVAGAGDGAADGAGDGTVDAGVTERVLARALPESGRSRAWVDGRMAPVGALSELGAGLVDIHGQHDQQSLLGVAGQRAALDAFAGSDLGPLAAARAALADVRARLAALGGDDLERARRADLLRYQVAEIGAARIEDDGEDTALAEEEERLAGMAAIREAAARALAALRGMDEVSGSGLDEGACGLVGRALSGLSAHPALEVWAGRLRIAAAELDEVAGDLRTIAETWEEDPARLAAVQARRRQLQDLRRKYGPTLADVVAFGASARASLSDMEGQDAEAAALAGRASLLEEAVRDAERKLRAARAAAGPALGAAVTARLRLLAMPDAELHVTVGEDGAGDAVGFLLAPNRGEPAQPLGRIASGGELARTMLALRLVVEGGATTMLFDEVDAGVGGAAALALARALREVAARRQVLVVTHLPQVAAFADHQVAVRKRVDAGGRTVTTAEVLGPEARVVELSRMLSGHPDSATARAHAAELLAVGTRSGGA